MKTTEHEVQTPPATLEPIATDTLLTTKMLADKILVSSRTLEGWRVKGGGPKFTKVGMFRIAYQWGDVLDWLESRKVNSTSESIAA